MTDLATELRQSIRALLQRPLFTVVAVLSVAVGIGANATMFSVFNALLLRAAPGVPDADRVVELGRTRGGRGFDSFTYAELQAMRAVGGPLELAAGARMVALSLSTGGEGRRVHGLAVSQEYFPILGVQPALGRFFTPDEIQAPGAGDVIVLSHAFWQDRFGGADVVGRTVLVNRHPFTIVGIGPPGFHGHISLLRADVWIPITMMAVAVPGFADYDQPRSSWLQAIGRLAPGATVAQANDALARMIARMRVDAPDFYEHRGAAAAELSGIPAAGRGPATAFLSLLLLLVGLILLVTCANVAGMLIARAAGREREIAIRLALGAGRGRLIRQLLIESLVLFTLGGLAGLLLATWGARALAAIPLPVPVPIRFDFSPDVRVVAFGAVLALTTGLLFGLAPALQSTRPDLVRSLKNESGRAASAGGRLRRLFVAAQVALTVVLLLSAGLFVRALGRAAAMDRGFTADDVALIGFDLSIDGYDAERGAAFLQRVRDHIGMLPGIAGVGLATDLPLDLSISESPVYPEGMVRDAEARGLSSAFAFVDGGYFNALRVPLVRGRVFDARDVASAEPVVVISRTLAERAWPGQDPIGRRLAWSDADGEQRVVIGVVNDVKNQTLMETVEPMTYLPIDQLYRSDVTLVARAASGAAAAAAALSAALRELDPRLSTTTTQSLASYTALGVLPQRVAAMATAAFGVLALLLSALGVYGVVAYMVAQRTREIGVRMALGADRRKVVRLVVASGLRLALPGAMIGALAGLGLAFLLRSFILGVSPADPVVAIGTPLLLVGAVLLACWLPARRAAAVEPMRALRAE